jgi:hypothetical protein
MLTREKAGQFHNHKKCASLTYRLPSRSLTRRRNPPVCSEISEFALFCCLCTGSIGDPLDGEPFLNDGKNEIDNPDLEDNSQDWASRRRRFDIRVFAGLIILTIVLPIVVIVTNTATVSIPATLRSQVLSECGTTPEEASARGCRFDLLSFGWTPQEC